MKGKAPSYGAFCRGMLIYKPGITLADIACNVMIFGHGTALSFFARQVLNHLDAGGQGNVMHKIAGPLAAIVLVSLARVAAIMACAVLDAMRGYYYQNRTRLALMRRIFARPDISFAAGSSGSLFEALDDDVPAGSFPAELLTEVAGYFICTLLTLAILLSISWEITLLVFLPLSAAILGVQRLSGSMQERRRSSRSAHDGVSAFLSDVADSVLTIKAAGAEADILKAFGQKNAARQKAVLRDSAFGASVNALLAASAHVGTAVMMCAFAAMMSGGAFKAGDFSIFVSSLFVLADCVNRIAELFSEYRKGEVSFERIMHAAQGNAPLPDDMGLTLRRKDAYAPSREGRPPAGELAVSGLSYGYGDGDGIQDVSFRIRPGELIAVAGGVGSGKSTLLNLLAGILRPDAGSIAWADGREVIKAPPSIAYAPQRPRFFSTDIADNLAMGQEIGAETLCAALRRAALLDVKLNTALGSRGATLSGGQRQRLALARMYAHDAQINLIDDNVSALDEAAQAAVLQNLLRYAGHKNRAVVIATNHRAFLEAADTVLVMKDGRIQAHGRYEALAASNEYLQSITA